MVPPQTICARLLCLSAVIKSLQPHLARSIVWSYWELQMPPVLLLLRRAYFMPALTHSQTEANCWGHWLSHKSTQVDVGALGCWGARKHPFFNVIRVENMFQNHASSYARNNVLVGEWKRWPAKVAENGIISSTKMGKFASPAADPQDLRSLARKMEIAAVWLYWALPD